ncbi:hypothetical protein PMALA_066490, partial [Plasmodium malariae]
MHNYNRSILEKIEKKKDLNDILQIKKSRAEKTFCFKDNIDNNSRIVEDFPISGNRRKEMNDEKIYGYKRINNKEVNNKIIEKENMLKSKLYNNSSNLKKKVYYDKLNVTNNNEKEYMKKKNTILNANLNNNYVEKTYFDDYNLVKDRSKFKRLGHFKEENNLSANCAYDDVNNAGSSMNNNTNININDNIVSCNNVSCNNVSYNDISGNDVNGNEVSGNDVNGNNVSGNNIHVNFNKGKMEPSNNEMMMNNIKYGKKNDYITNSNYNKFGKSQNKYIHTDYKDHVMAGGVTPGTTIGAPSSYIQRDKMYHRNVNEMKNNPNIVNNVSNKEIFKNDVIVSNDNQINEEFMEHNNMNDGMLANNVNNEFQRGKNLPKGMVHPKSCTFLAKEQIITLSSKTGGSNNNKISCNNYSSNNNNIISSKYNDDTMMDDERDNNNHSSKYHNSSMKRDMYTNYAVGKNDLNEPPNKNIVDIDSNRKKEYHNFSISTIDSNYSNKNVYEKKIPSKYLGPHLMQRHENSKDIIEEKSMPNDDGKIYPASHINPLERNVPNMPNNIVLPEYGHTSEYDYINPAKNNKGSNNNMKYTFRKDGNLHPSDKQRYLERDEIEDMSKNFEYNKNDTTEVSQEFVNDNMNKISHDKRKENFIIENRMSKGNNIIHNSRDKSNIKIK